MEALCKVWEKIHQRCVSFGHVDTGFEDSIFYQFYKNEVKHRSRKQMDKAKKLKSENPELYKEKIKHYNRNYKRDANKANAYRKRKWKEIQSSPEAKEKYNLSMRSYYRSKIKNDPHRYLGQRLRNRVSCALRRKSLKKCYKTHDLIGCETEFLKKHLESKFLPGMTWNNYGKNGWHIDHVRPCATFDLSDPEQQKKCFHYTNLQPLWEQDNLTKGKKFLCQSGL